MNDAHESRQEPGKPRNGATGNTVFIVGSGFGGAVAACRLAQAGFDVHLFERGRRYESKDFPALPVDAVLLPDFQRWTWQNNQGLWDILDLEEIISVQAAGYGGGSLVYANVHLRPPRAVFDSRWPRAYQEGTLDAFYRLAGYMLDAAPITEHAIFPGVVKADQLKKTMTGLGRGSAFFYPPLAVNREPKVSIGGRTQKACTGCGACCSGCPETAKNTLDYNYLALAEKWGVRVHTQCEVTDVRSKNADGVLGSDGWHVEYVDHVSGDKCILESRHVFVCAGSVHSTRLLARADLPSVKTRVGVGYFPGGDALGMVYDTKNIQYPSYGPAITTTTVHWEATEASTPARYFLIQDGGYAQELARFVGLLRAPAWIARNRLAKSSPAARTPASERSSFAEAQRVISNSIALPSLADDLLKAVARGDFHGAIPDALVKNWDEVLTKDLVGPLLIPGIVTSVIDGAMRSFFAKNALTKGFKPDGWLLKAIARFERWLIRVFFGTDQELAERALRSALNGADLPRDRWAEQVLGYDGKNANNRVMLLAMGRDAARGALHYYRQTDRLVADLDLFHLAPGYSNQERLMTDIATSLGGELRTNPAWAFLGKPITVHNQGGCPMSDEPRDGVTDPNGKVHGCEGLYVLDGAILCTSVGVNPSATIAAIAERNILKFIQTQLKTSWPDGDSSKSADEYRSQREASRSWGERFAVSPPDAENAPPRDFDGEPLGITFSEKMQGYFAATDTPFLPKKNGEFPDDRFLVFENQGRPSSPVNLELTLSVVDLQTFFEDETHAMGASGSVTLRLPGTLAVLPYQVLHGRAEILTPRFKPYGIPKKKDGQDNTRLDAQIRLGHGYTTEYLDSHSVRNPQRFFSYTLWFNDRENRPWTLFGYKRVRDNPALDAWRDTSTLFVTLFDGHLTKADALEQTRCRGAGAVHVELSNFLFEQLRGMNVTGTTDPARIVWGLTSFAYFFFGSLLRVHSPAIGSAVDALLGKHHDNVITEPHRPPWRRWSR